MAQGPEVGTAYVSILPSGAGFASALGAQLSGQVAAPAQKAAGLIESSLGGAFKNVAAIAGTALTARAVFGFAQASVDAARESNRVAAQTAAVLASTGGVAGVTAKQVDSLANSIARKTGIDDEQVASAENLLLTFTNIRNAVGKNNDVFTQATKIAVDMGAALGGDAASNAIQLGKALQDPVRGLTSLQRVGVAFTQQQRDQIQALVDSGNVLEAQKIILGELTTEFGGSAAAQGTAIDKLNVAFGNFEETIGRVLIPILNVVATTITKSLEIWNALPGPVKVALDAVAAFTAAVLVLNLTLALNPIGAVIVALSALVAGVVFAWQNIQVFRDVVKAAFQVIVNTFADGVGFILDLVAKLAGGLATIAEAATRLPVIGGQFKGVAQAIRSAQHDLQGWAEQLHTGIDTTDKATGAVKRHGQALGDAADDANALAAAEKRAQEAADKWAASIKGSVDDVKAFRDKELQWSQQVGSDLQSALSPVKSLADKEIPESAKAINDALGSAISPLQRFVPNLRLSLGSLKANLRVNVRDLQAWKDDIAAIAAGGHQGLADAFAALGPEAARAVHEARKQSSGELDALQAQFTTAGRLAGKTLGDKAADASKVSLAKIGTNLDENLKVVTAWRADLEKLASRGHEGLAKALGQLGPEVAGAALHEAVTSASGPTLDALEKKFRDAGALSADAMSGALQDRLSLEANPGKTIAQLVAQRYQENLTNELVSSTEVAMEAVTGILQKRLIPGITPGIFGPIGPDFAGLAGASPVALTQASVSRTPGVTPGLAGPISPKVFRDLYVTVPTVTNANTQEVADAIGAKIGWALR